MMVDQIIGIVSLTSIRNKDGLSTLCYATSVFEYNIMQLGILKNFFFFLDDGKEICSDEGFSLFEYLHLS